ncbi:MAG: epoxyqueuosine reductase [Firmicutes bacterium]|nr:epoxyqueuosine reductase [Bacillota bacterium]
MNTERDNSFKAELKEHARRLGADLVGIAPMERFAPAPDGYKPTDFMPSARSVVVMARKLPEAALESRHRFTVYTMVNIDTLKRMDHLALDLANFIESRGGRALPIPADEPYTYWDEENRRGMGELSHRHAAAAAGLGVLGRNTLLITPQYGNRVLLVSVVTDREIEPDPLVTLELCPAKCRLCLDACPAGALDGGPSVAQKKCREVCQSKVSKGHSVYSCWECRRVCPARARVNSG